jgi:hypothetical protein
MPKSGKKAAPGRKSGATARKPLALKIKKPVKPASKACALGMPFSGSHPPRRRYRKKR